MFRRFFGNRPYSKLPTEVNVSYKKRFKEAILDDNLDEAQMLLENKFKELELLPRELNNALHLVSGSKHPKALRTVTELLTRSANPNARRSDGETPLFLASYTGNKQIVSELLGVGANPDIGRDDDVTPLMMASEQGHVEVVSLLLTHGANVDLEDSEGNTALKYATNPLIIKLLTKHSAATLWALNTERKPLLGKGGRRTRRSRGRRRRSRGRRRRTRR